MNEWCLTARRRPNVSFVPKRLSYNNVKKCIKCKGLKKYQKVQHTTKNFYKLCVKKCIKSKGSKIIKKINILQKRQNHLSWYISK